MLIFIRARNKSIVNPSVLSLKCLNNDDKSGTEQEEKYLLH
jgi:hypothetical protein